MAIIFITHDLGVVAELCDEVVVMYAGRAVEQADIYELFDHPRHPYTRWSDGSDPASGRCAKEPAQDHQGSGARPARDAGGVRFSNRCPCHAFAWRPYR